MYSDRLDEIRDWLEIKKSSLQKGGRRALTGNETLKVLSILTDLIDEIEELPDTNTARAVNKLETIIEKGITLYKCPYPECSFKSERAAAVWGHVRFRHLLKGEHLDANGNVVEGPPTTTVPRMFPKSLPLSPRQTQPCPTDSMTMKPSEYLKEQIIEICSLDKKPCRTAGKCSACKKARKKFVDRVVHSKSKKFQDGYQQALDDIRWGRCKHKNFEYHARARSQEDRLDEIRALDKEMKGGGNIPQG